MRPVATLGGLLCLFLFLAAPPARAGEATAGKAFPPSTSDAQIQDTVDAARREARDSGRLLMLVLGADWCHDSRAFVEHLSDPELGALLDARYVVQRIDIGYFDFVREVVAPWDVPVIYGTPTVLVIEPASGRVLNRESLSHWRNAAILTPVDAVAYFEDFSPGPPPPAPAPTPPLAEALAAIDAFERDQAERIYTAYAVLGDLMREMGDERPGPEFMEKWNNLAALRRDITRDLADLRAEARRRAAAGESDIRLNYPDYDLFID